MTYSAELLDHFFSPRHPGTLPYQPISIGEAGSIAQGNQVKIYLYYRDNFIHAASFQAYGTPATIASASLVTEWLTSVSRQEAANWQHQDIIIALKLSKTQWYSAILVEKAVQLALTNIQTLHLCEAITT